MSFIPPPRMFLPFLSLGILLASESAAAPVVIFMVHSPAFNLELSGAVAFMVGVALAALLVGLLAWWLFVVKPRHATIPRGILIGAIGSILAHPVMWVIIGFIAILADPSHDYLGFVPIETIGSLILVGWFTTPIGAGAGALLIWLQRTLTSYAQHDNRKAEAC